MTIKTPTEITVEQLRQLIDLILAGAEIKEKGFRRPTDDEYQLNITIAYNDEIRERSKLIKRSREEC